MVILASSLIKWEPFKGIERFLEEDWPFVQLPRIGRDLAVDVYEEKSNVTVEMNLPGIDPDKVDITFQDHYLKVCGSREEEKETKEKNCYSKEIRRGSFERAVRLPAEVKENMADAEYKEGVLRISIPKKEEAQKGVKIKVKK